MIQISHIVSSDLLDLIDGRDFYMCLANIAAKDKEYANFYKKQVEKGAFVLLDNGAAEHDQMTLETMWNVISYINPNEVVLNDELCNGEKTIEKSLEAIEYYRSRGYKGQFMFVPQGKDIEEWTKCYLKMDLSDISTIGVSKYVTSAWENSAARIMCCNKINPNIQVHLLGCHENIKEVEVISNSFSNIRSNDTAIAYIYAQANKNILDGDRPEGEINFLKSDLNEDQLYMLKKNIFEFDNSVIRG